MTDGKFWLYLLANGVVSESTLTHARSVQQEYPFLRIGEILMGVGAFGLNTLRAQLQNYRAQAKLGELLLLENAITVAQLEEALARQADSGLLIGKILIDMGACSFEQVMKALAVQRSQQAQVQN